MGKRYAREEIKQIQAMVTDGLTDREIATRLNRSEDGIRNIRHRSRMKAETTKSLQTLQHDEKQLSRRVSNLQMELVSLEARRKNIQKVIRTEEGTLNQRLQSALTKLKEVKPELFQITVEEQIGKIVGELTGAFLKWLISK